jgi:hypothetical protein
LELKTTINEITQELPQQTRIRRISEIEDHSFDQRGGKKGYETLN